VLDAVNLKGHHAVLYGERGVGKTSLANVIAETLTSEKRVIVSKVNCDTSDDFDSVWKKAFSKIEFYATKPAVGFSKPPRREQSNLADQFPQKLVPNEVIRQLESLSREAVLIIVLDEFDRLPRSTTTLLSDCIKTLSDQAVNVTLMLVGVADSVGELIEEHQSIERALIQIPVPRMPRQELSQIVENGTARLGLSIDRAALDHITALSQGLPYYTHLLSLYASRQALDRHSMTITPIDVKAAIRDALDKSQQSIKSAYYEATRSQHTGNIYRQVLLACALAVTDEFGFFTAAAVREPLSRIMKKSYDIPSFARHLKVFSEPRSGRVLQKVGQERRFRFRFSSPLMQPFVIMTGLNDGLIDVTDV
jgi:Cdc6-like AAA superfamily ATPase